MTRFVTKMLLLGGLAGLAAGTAGAGTAAAGTVVGDVPALVVRYNSDMLETDSGARALYRRLARAAEQVCPDVPSNTRIVSEVIVKCRQQAIDAAVNKIHNQRLAAVHAASAKSG
ncbi:MAG TPA: UrcA family protein [Steroidobacteraceae bacterium]